MSLEKQPNNTAKNKIFKEIRKLLREEFNIEEEWIDFIIKPLQGYVWKEDYFFFKNTEDIASNANVKNLPSFYLVDEKENTVEKVSFTPNPLNLSAFYIKRKYGEKIFPFYFYALIYANEPKEYLKEIKKISKVPFIKELKKLKTKPLKEVLNEKYGK